MAQIVITHDGLDGARAVIDEVSLPEFADVGWTHVGPWCGVPGSTLTDAEWAADVAPPRPKKAAPTTKKASI
jgi:hypothetical protein